MIILEKNTRKIVNISELEVNNKYYVSQIISYEEYKGNTNCYMKEGFYDGRTLHFATKYDGSKPFAVETNDCERDEFDAYELAKVLVENGFYIFIAYIENKVINYKVFDIMDTKSDYVIERNYVEVKLVNSFTSLEKEEFIKENPKFEKAVLHAIEAINSDFPDQLLPKYCFNPNRLVYVKLFEKDEKGNYYTYNDEGKKLVLNKFSKSLDKINDNPIMRVFHSRKFNDKNVILVDGVPVREVKHYDLHDYIEKSHIDSHIAKSSLYELTTKCGKKYYGFYTINGDMRLLYKSTKGYSSYSLNEYEMMMFTSVEKIDI